MGGDSLQELSSRAWAWELWRGRCILVALLANLKCPDCWEVPKRRTPPKRFREFEFRV